MKARIQVVIDILEKVEGDIQLKNNPEVFSFAANKKWLSIPEITRRKLESNVWCGSCSGVTQIEKYSVKESQSGILLQGKCKKCGHDVVRSID
ncbi:hypothetical protein NDK43_10510 [Neobacillus pocheonensis]|uniref:Uncharacterized protein n=1 Tax=Neobacillus pocheonensis TaxID=363869 RepID=A0ABT0W8T5_9BACI|nr:hypothetical protein [Neobacillus pocheonensis]